MYYELFFQVSRNPSRDGDNLKYENQVPDTRVYIVNNRKKIKDCTDL